MGEWIKCECKGRWKEKRENWRVVFKNVNHSHFESPKGAAHYSEYSLVTCIECGANFRTKAKYVDELAGYI